MPLPHIRTELPGPKARALMARDRAVSSPSYPRDYPFVMARGRGVEVWDVGGEIQKSIAVDVPDLDSASPGHDERIVARVGGRTHGTIACHQCPGPGSGQFSADVRQTHRESSG